MERFAQWLKSVFATVGAAALVVVGVALVCLRWFLTGRGDAEARLKERDAEKAQDDMVARGDLKGLRDEALRENKQ